MRSRKSTKELSSEDLARAIAVFRNDPVGFNEKILGRGPYWSRQVEICESVRDNHATIVATGNSVGKSYLAAGSILWWLFTRPNSLVVMTAPSQTLLGTVLCKEIRAAVHSSRTKGIPLPCFVTDSPKASPQVVEISPGWHAIGLSTRGVERLSGQHNPNLYVVVDEASGILASAWEAIASLNALKLLVLGNPLSGFNEFERLFKLGLVQNLCESIPGHMRTRSFRIPSTESPDLHLDRARRGLADAGFIRQAEERWQRGSVLWLTHIDAKFPEQAAYGLAEQSWIDRSFAAPLPSETQGKLILSVDIGCGVGADRSVLLVRDELAIREIYASKFDGLASSAALVGQFVRKYGIPDDQVIYDAMGVGRDFPLHLRNYGIRNPIAYAGSASGFAGNGLSFKNLRASSAWRLRRILDPDRPRKAIPVDRSKFAPWQLATIEAENRRPTSVFAMPACVLGQHANSLHEELCNLRYVPGLRIGLESKDAIRERLGRSPDLADALIMSFAIGIEDDD